MMTTLKRAVILQYFDITVKIAIITGGVCNDCEGICQSNVWISEKL